MTLAIRGGTLGENLIATAVAVTTLAATTIAGGFIGLPKPPKNGREI